MNIKKIIKLLVPTPSGSFIPSKPYTWPSGGSLIKFGLFVPTGLSDSLILVFKAFIIFFII